MPCYGRSYRLASLKMALIEPYKTSILGGCTWTEFVSRTLFLCETSEKKIESSNDIASAFRDCNAAQEMCLYARKPNSLPEKLEYAKITGQKTKVEAD